VVAKWRNIIGHSHKIPSVNTPSTTLSPSGQYPSRWLYYALSPLTVPTRTYSFFENSQQFVLVKCRHGPSIHTIFIASGVW
jgi:hypothetical protein